MLVRFQLSHYLLYFGYMIQSLQRRLDGAQTTSLRAETTFILTDKM